MCRPVRSCEVLPSRCRRCGHGRRRHSCRCVGTRVRSPGGGHRCGRRCTLCKAHARTRRGGRRRQRRRCDIGGHALAAPGFAPCESVCARAPPARAQRPYVRRVVCHLCPPLRPLGARARETVLAPVLAHACSCTQCYPAETGSAEASVWVLRREICADLRSLAPPRAGARWGSEAARAESGTARADPCVLMAGSSPSARARVRIRLRFDQCCKQVLSTLRSATVAIGVIVFSLCAYVHVRSCPAARARAATRHARAQGTTRACIQCAIAFTGPSTVSIICCSPVASPATTSAMSP